MIKFGPVHPSYLPLSFNESVIQVNRAKDVERIQFSSKDRIPISINCMYLISVKTLSSNEEGTEDEAKF